MCIHGEWETPLQQRVLIIRSMLINGPCDGLDVLIEHELSIMFGMGLCKEQDEINIYTTTIASDNTEVFLAMVTF